MKDQISCEKLFKQRDKFTVIDTRSPKEYEYSHIPSAISCPILDNHERHIVGLCYKEKGQIQAMRLGFETFIKKFDKFVEEILSYGEKDIVISCARGGLRSKLVVDLFNNRERIIETIKEVKADLDVEELKDKISKLKKINIYQLKGGYKSYRKFVLESFRKYNDKFNFEFVTLYGLTCSGKTRVLNNLEKEGKFVIDLEGLAQHRSSLFGSLGLEPRSQKMFENLLLDKLVSFPKGAKVYTEGESRKIGKLCIPLNFYKTMNKGTKILIRASMEDRIKITKEEYFDKEEKIEAGRKVLDRLVQFLGRKNVENLKQKLDEKKYDFVIRLLLEEYYDKKYKITREENDYDLVLDWKDVEILKNLESKNVKNQTIHQL